MSDLPGSPPSTARTRDTSLRSAIDNPYVVLTLLFFVTGVLGLPVLWISRGFGRTSKIILSVVVTIYTLLLIGCTISVIWWSWARALESL